MAEVQDNLVLEHVRLRLGSAALDFDCEIPGGKITAVAGPSGSGKSTLLNLIAGFEQPDEGRILLGGQDITRRHPAERPVSLVFQDHNLFAHLDLFTNIGLGINSSLALDAKQKGEISVALERVGLKGFERRKPPTLSGGERQRAAFARALVRKKPFLLLDEPFASLDPGLRSDMAGLLTALHRETNNTIVMVSHDSEEVMRLADRVLFLEDGKIIFEGTTEAFAERGDIAAIGRFLGA